MPDGLEKDIATKRFFARLASLYATPEGHIFQLAEMIGLNRRTFISQISSRVPISDIAYQGILKVLHPASLPELRRIHREQTW